MRTLFWTVTGVAVGVLAGAALIPVGVPFGLTVVLLCFAGLAAGCVAPGDMREDQ